MAHITQLIINGVRMPYASRDRYQAKEELLGETREMISGRVTTEGRGLVYFVRYEYDYILPEIWNTISPYLKNKKAFPCTFLTTEGEMKGANMVCTELTQPSFAFDINGKAYWHNIAFTLREERPHADNQSGV